MEHIHITKVYHDYSGKLFTLYHYLFETIT